MTRRLPPRPGVRAATAGAVVAALVGGGAVWWFASGGPARTGFAAASCPSTSAVPEVSYDTAFDARLRRTVLPVGPPPLAPYEARVCRYPASGAPSGVALDPARTAELAAAVAAPLDGYPADALAAKRIPELTDAQLAANAAAPCGVAAPVTVIRFAYREAPEVLVRVDGAPCASLTNGRLTIRTPQRVTQALDAVPGRA